jgi:hypothetical protein
MYYIFNRYLSSKTLFIWVSELALLFTTALLLTALRLNFQTAAVVSYDPQFLKTIVLTVTYAVIFHYLGLYTPELYHPSRQMLTRLIQATGVATIVVFCIFFIFPSTKAWRGIILGYIVVLPFFLVGWRKLFSRWVKVELPSNRVLIIGSGDLAKKIGADIYNKYVHGLKLVGFIDDDPSKLGHSIVNPGVVGGYGDIGRIADVEKIDRIIIALHDRRAKLPMSALLDCKLRGISIEEGETFHERATGKIPLDHLKPSWMVFSDGFKSLRSRKILKRFFDVLLSITGLLIASPILLLTSILIRCESKGPTIFSQKRVGENGKIFEIYKFRSMRQDAEASTGPVWAGTDDQRITTMGRFIRKTRRRYELRGTPSRAPVLRGKAQGGHPLLRDTLGHQARDNRLGSDQVPVRRHGKRRT